MPAREIHRCQCPCCQQAEPHPDQELHAQMNLLLSRLDEQQRRWYAAVESHKVGHGGDNTPAFAAAALRQWWARLGCQRYGRCERLLILADGGGSNGYRPRLWKKALQEEMADRYGLQLTVCHYPTGASKWNPIEHRLFGPISINWAGEPLRSLGRLLAFVRGTTTRGGLVVTAGVDGRRYATGVRVSDSEMKDLRIRYHDTCPQWNYTISPRLNYQWN